MWQSSYDGSPSVYLVPTPIGNLDDMTFRAIDILKSVDVIFSEDTRVTLQLLNYFNIKNKLIHLDDHNENIVADKVLSYLKDFKNVAIVTDRGTPIISDPGYKTVRLIKENGFNVIALPGSCAFVPALVASSLSSEHFLFYGFLSNKQGKMEEELNYLKDFEYTIVFYEAPHRIIKTLNTIYNIFGNRMISISREISKLHESVFLGRVDEAIKSFDVVRGEFVIVVAPDDNDNFNNGNLDVVETVKLYINSGLSSMDAIKRTAKDFNLPKGEVYKLYIEKVK